MKTITKNPRPLFVMILGIIFTFSVNGQMFKNFSTCDNIKPESQILKLQPEFSFLNFKPEVTIPVHKSTQGSFPQEIHHFYWDVMTIWMADYNKFISYDNQANKLTQITVNANTGDTTTGTVNTYNAQGKLIESVNQIWNNGSWVNDVKFLYEYDEQGNPTLYVQFVWQANVWQANGGTKYTYTYDVNNNITEKIYQTWNNNTTSWENFYKWISTYDFNGYLIERVFQTWDSNTSSWSSTGKQTYTNSSGVIIEVLMQSWDNLGSIWVNEEKLVNIVWHTWTGDLDESELASYTVLTWNNGIWQNYYRINTTYDAYGGWVKTQEGYFNGNWINSTRETNSYDEHENFVGWKMEMWFNNVWVTDMANQLVLSYSGNDVTQSIQQIWDPMGQEFKNQWKEEYSDFIYIQGIEMNSFMASDIQLYPNPTNGVLNVEVLNSEREMISLQIVNINGQVVYSKQMNASDFPVHKIDLSNCSKGVYFLKLQNTSEVKVGKVILQ